MLYRNFVLVGLLFVITAGFTTVGNSNAVQGDAKRWIVNENSNLRVNGKTNVNTFLCEIVSYPKPDTLALGTDKSNAKDFALTGSLNLNIKNFDCHNLMMTHDLRKTLKENQFPVLRISFISLSKFTSLNQQPENIKGIVEIELAGCKKRFEVTYQIYADDPNAIHLIGRRDINFSDFNLIPPTKLGGIIRTEDKLSVDFHLKIRPL